MNQDHYEDCVMSERIDIIEMSFDKMIQSSDIDKTTSENFELYKIK
jgi:hypothetical protein